jgi:hypothetical protein
MKNTKTTYITVTHKKEIDELQKLLEEKTGIKVSISELISYSIKLFRSNLEKNNILFK